MNMRWTKIKIEAYVNEIAQSISDDVGTAIQGYSDAFHKKGKPSGGFFAIPRMLFPEIDCLGSYITGKSLNTSENIVTYLKVGMSKVNPKYSDLAVFITFIFRHGLLHQHQPKVFSFKGKEVGWMFSINNPNNPIEVAQMNHLRFQGDFLMIETNVFYKDLLESIRLMIPEFTSAYRSTFIKSINEQLKPISKNFLYKKPWITKDDFKFLNRL